MIGSLVEYAGTYKSLHGKRAIVVKKVATVFRRGECAWEVRWVQPVVFGGRRVTSSKMAPGEFKIVSGGYSESE